MLTSPLPIARVLKGTPALVLAPMEGVTDAPMRALLSELGGFSYCVAEFLRVSQEIPPRWVFERDVPELAHQCRTPSGLPVQVQLLGGDPARLAQAALIAVEAGAHSIDLNFGCPAPTVNRHDGGATLLKHPERVRAIVSGVRQALPREVPVSAKLRLGWDDMAAIHRNADMAIEGGADWITIHGRTRMQGYVPPAYWGPIGEVRARSPVPVVANGEIWTLDDFKRCRDETGCEHFMIGRGALADPLLQHRIARELGLVSFEPATKVDWPRLLKRFAELGAPDDGSGTGHGSRQSARRRSGFVPARIKQWARMSHKREPLAWFDRLKTMESVDEMLALVSSC